jgi:preprotein translocase subunit YajC
MQEAFWTIGVLLLFAIVAVVLLLGPWFSIHRVRKKRSKKHSHVKTALIASEGARATRGTQIQE